jgi:hypothetical protein
VIELYVLDVPEFRPVIDEGSRRAASARKIGNYVEIVSREALTIDRKAAGARRSVWFSSIGALRNGTVTQFDSDSLRIEPASQ